MADLRRFSRRTASRGALVNSAGRTIFSVFVRRFHLSTNSVLASRSLAMANDWGNDGTSAGVEALANIYGQLDLEEEDEVLVVEPMAQNSSKHNLTMVGTITSEKSVAFCFKMTSSY
ncbi:unnamed protein product [Cuscuta epithymum]|uniref:Uncharacterized protein n=1 Tax=Cuscuta epithymum TaxID=186058 RepID=A0AAV0BX78_9ASTE|nr:unnamed protein product [Cuscuta epithymum]